MNALFIGFAVYVIASIICGAINKIPRPARKTKAAQKPVIEMYTPATATRQEKPPENNAVLNALTESRNTIIDSISEIDYLLDNAAQGREKLIDRRLKLLDKLATVEIKINKYS